MPIEITDDLVAHVARLSRLGISSTEALELKGHFQKILDFVKSLDALDVSGVDPSIFPLSTSNVFREDEVRPSLPVEEALRNAPAAREGHFLVPRIVAERAGAGADAVDEPAESA
jgi:aspartyl-tRNA(Asn)/glutamyl-tRNA(Gln) amidotransferase subunit C